MVRPAFTDGMCTSTSWKVCWSHWRAGPFPFELWEVLLLSFSNTFPSTAVHNQSPHPALVFCLNPVSERDPGIYIRLGGSGPHVCRRRECVCRFALVPVVFHPWSCSGGLDVTGGPSAGRTMLFPPEPDVRGEGTNEQTSGI